MAPKNCALVSSFLFLVRDLFLHTSTFYQSKTYTCQNPRFPHFFQQIKRSYPHLYLLPKWDLQVRRDRFYKINEKININNLTFRTLRFGSNCCSIWFPFASLLPPFWLHLDRFRYPVWSILNFRRCFFLFSKNMFLSTQDRESNVDWVP